MTRSPTATAPRRGFLLGLLRATCGLALLSASRPAPPEPAPASPADLRIARLGAHLAREDRVLARELARSVEREMPAWLRVAGARRRASVMRQRLLEPGRLRREWQRGEVLRVDGWLLARSEVAAAAWLHARLGPERMHA